MVMQPRAYQEEAIEQGLSAKFNGFLIGDDMGLGKTLTTVEIVNRGYGHDARVLVVCPLNTFTGWERHIMTQNPDAKVYIHPPGGKTSKGARLWWEAMESGRVGWYIIGWEGMRGAPSREQAAEYKARAKSAKDMGLKAPPKPIYRHWGAFPGFDVVVFDEVHRAVNRKSITGKTVKTIKARYRIGLSGTPAGNKVEGYWNIIDLLWPGYLPAFWTWVQDFCRTERNQFSGKKIVGEKTPGTIVQNCIPSYIRRETYEVNTELPEVIERKVRVDLLPGVQKKAYAKLRDEAMAWLEDKPLGTPLGVEQALRLRQIALGVPTIAETGELNELGFPKITVSFSKDAKSSKIDAVKDIITDLPEDEPVIVFTPSAVFTVPLVYQLNKAGLGPAVAFTGKTSGQGRLNILRYFGKQAGPRIIVAGIKAIGEGTDGLQHVCSHEIWVGRDDNNVLNGQAARRLHRPGQTRPVQRWMIEAVGTIDEEVFERTEENTKRMNKAYG